MKRTEDFLLENAEKLVDRTDNVRMQSFFKDVKRHIRICLVMDEQYYRIMPSYNEVLEDDNGKILERMSETCREDMVGNIVIAISNYMVLISLLKKDDLQRINKEITAEIDTLIDNPYELSSGSMLMEICLKLQKRLLSLL